MKFQLFRQILGASRPVGKFIVNRGEYLLSAALLISIVIFSRDDLISIIVLSIATFIYLRSYIDIIENRYLKKGILKNKDIESRSYKHTIFANRLLFFLLFMFLEANFLPQFFSYNPSSLGMYAFLMIQASFVIDIFNLSESTDDTSSNIKYTLLKLFVYPIIVILALAAFVTGLYALESSLVRTISSSVFIGLMFGSLLWLWSISMKFLSKFVKPIPAIGNMFIKGSLGEGSNPPRYIGRCRKCWGSIDVIEWIAPKKAKIECKVCGKSLEGSQAEKEQKRMLEELGLNCLKNDMGQQPVYSRGAFRLKFLPAVDRLTEKELSKRIAAKTRHQNKQDEDKLSRKNFPQNEPGLLFFQAKMLMAGIDYKHDPDIKSIVTFPGVTFKKDGALAMKPMPVDHPEYPEIMSKMGITTIESLTASFACELVMKAISLTCKDEALRTHNLSKLFSDLPQESRKAIEADCLGATKVLAQFNQAFGEDKYLEGSDKKRKMMAMINLERTRKISKVARVMLDEAIRMGLKVTVKTNANRKVRMKGSQSIDHQKVKVDLYSEEAPPR